MPKAFMKALLSAGFSPNGACETGGWPLLNVSDRGCYLNDGGVWNRPHCLEFPGTFEWR